MRFEVLGPLRVTDRGTERPLGGPQQRLVLALLVSADGEIISTDRLIDSLWGEETPPTARKAVQGYIHHLRTSVGAPITTQPTGYALDANGATDAAEFIELHHQASQAEAGEAAELLRQALALWRGRAYADLRDVQVLAPEIARLDNLRLVAVGDRIDADLALGRHEALIGELEGLTLEHPFQERFRAQHMTALYRAGRLTEALRSFERYRRFLADESGLEPSEELKQLEEQILNQDGSLLLDESADTTSGPAAIRGYELRERVASDEVSETYRAYQRSVGRQVAVRVIGPAVANDPVFISNFLSDTQRVAEADHPNISYVFDTWREPGRAYQISRWLGGGTLEDAPPSGLRSGLSILSVIGDALAQAHRHGVAHGSVDGSHIVFDENGHPYLVGFTVGYPRTGADLARDRLDFAVLAHRVISGRPPREVDRRRQPDIDDSALSPVFEVAFSEEGYGRVEDFMRALRQAAGADVVAITPETPPRTDVRNPYKGLKAFQETDAGDFYGRDEVIERLAQTLERRRLVAVVGPSGSGKSSVVKAGLLPRLRSESELRLFTDMYPGAFPFEELEGALLRVGVDRTSLIEDLIADDRGLVRILNQIVPSDSAELVLVIDQFEELFSTVDDERTRRLFLDSLVNAVSEPRSRLRVVVTMRADFFDRPLEHPRLGELVEAGLVPIILPDDDHLAQATVMPARSEGVEFEDGLVAQIVLDVSGQPGGLPLLQYALTELFEARDTDILTLAAYQRSGGVHGALGRRAEGIYQDLTPEERASAREALLRMVTVDENADDLRRRVRRSDLAGIGNQRDLDSALQAYAAARLITFDRDPVTRGPTVEVAHEALLREWPRLRDWIEEQRDDLVIRRRLDTALEEWEQSGQDDGYLPTGSRLAQFEEWASETQLALSETERGFLQAGVEREVERKARALRRRRWIMAGFGIAAVVAAVFGLAALRNAETARAEALAAAAIEQLDDDPERSVLLALESLDVAETPNGLTALHQALQSHRTLWTNPPGCPEAGARPPLACGPGPFAFLHPDGRHIVTATFFGRVSYWDAEADSSEPLWTSELTDGARAGMSRPWIDPEQNVVILPYSDLGPPEFGWSDSVAGEHRGFYTIDLDTGDLVDYQPLDGCATQHGFPPPSDRAAPPALFMIRLEVAEDNPTKCALPPADPEMVVRQNAPGAEWVTLHIPGGPFESPNSYWDFSSDGKWFTFSSSDTGALLLDTTTGEVVKTYPEADRATLSRDAERILLYKGWFEGAERVELVDIESGEVQVTVPGRFEWIRFTPDQDLLVGLIQGNASVKVIDPESGELVRELVGPEIRPFLLRFDGSSRRVLVNYGLDFRLWNLGTAASEVEAPITRVIESDEELDRAGVTVGDGLVFVPGFTQGGTGYAIYDVNGELVRQSSSGRGFMSPDGSMIVEIPLLDETAQTPSGSEATRLGRPRLVDTRTGVVIQELPSTCTFFSLGLIEREQGPDCDEGDVFLDITDAQFSDDQTMLAVETSAATPTVFDLAANELIFHQDVPLGHGGSPLQRVALSPAGTTVVYEDPSIAVSIPSGFRAVDVRSGETLGVSETCGISKAMFSNDGARLYVTDFCADILVFETETWTEVARFGRAKANTLADLAVSGNVVATVGTDDVVRVWDVDADKLLLEVQLDTTPRNVEFLDRSHILVTTVEGEVFVFTLDPEELKSIAIDRLTRGFTEEECGIYNIDPCPTLEEITSRS